MRDPILLTFPNDRIIFRGNILHGSLSTQLTLKNPDSQPVLFKVKTTKPERYCVSPAHGTVEPNGQIELLIKVKETGVNPDAITKDKFLVQSIQNQFVAKGIPVEEAFRRIKNADLMQQKMHVDVVLENKQYEAVQEERNSRSFQSNKTPRVNLDDVDMKSNKSDKHVILNPIAPTNTSKELGESFESNQSISRLKPPQLGGLVLSEHSSNDRWESAVDSVRSLNLPPPQTGTDTGGVMHVTFPNLKDGSLTHSTGMTKPMDQQPPFNRDSNKPVINVVGTNSDIDNQVLIGALQPPHDIHGILGPSNHGYILTQDEHGNAVMVYQQGIVGNGSPASVLSNDPQSKGRGGSGSKKGSSGPIWKDGFEAGIHEESGQTFVEGRCDTESSSKKYPRDISMANSIQDDHTKCIFFAILMGFLGLLIGQFLQAHLCSDPCSKQSSPCDF